MISALLASVRGEADGGRRVVMADKAIRLVTATSASHRDFFQGLRSVAAVGQSPEKTIITLRVTLCTLDV